MDKNVCATEPVNDSSLSAGEIRSPVKVRLPISYPSPRHEWISIEALWDAGAAQTVMSPELASKIGAGGIDLSSLDIVVMGRVLFQTCPVLVRDVGSTAASLVIGMDVIAKCDEEAKRQLAVCLHCPNCRGTCLVKGTARQDEF
ncbi:MAG: hypothetical protein ABSG63_18580 [Spirochaetia bacterium]|jgi:hypothetical protein